MKGTFAALLIATGLVSGLRCKSTTSEEFSIDVQVLIPQGFPSYPNATFALTVDEPADAGALFSGSAPLRGGTTESGLAYTSEIGDFDGDGRSEWQMRFNTNPFGQTGVPLQTTLTGNLGDRVFKLVGELKDGTTTLASGSASADSNGEGLRFGPSKRNVTVQLYCTAAVTGCVNVTPDAGTDGGTIDGGIADGGTADGGIADGGITDGGGAITDAGTIDAGPAVACDSATVVGVDASTSYRPSIVADSTGAVHVAWYQNAAGGPRVLALKRSPDGDWEAASTISSGDAGGYAPLLRADALGNTYVVWYSSGVPGTQYWFSRRTATGVWSAPVAVGAPTTFWSQIMAFAVGANSHGVLAWDNRGSPWWNIRAVAYDPDAGWGDAGVIADWDGGYTMPPRAIVDSIGRAMVYWCQQRNDGSRYDPWTVRYEPDGGFLQAVNVDSSTNNDTITCVDIVTAPSGGVRPVWLRATTLWTREFVPEAGWQSIWHGSSIYSDAGTVSFSTSVASAPDSNILAALAPTNIAEIVIRRFSASELRWIDLWTLAKNQGVGSSLSLAAVADGGAWLAWLNSVNNVRVSRYPFDGGWSPPETVVDTDGGSPSAPTLTPFGDGGLLLTWVRSSLGALRGDIYAATCR